MRKSAVVAGTVAAAAAGSAAFGGVALAWDGHHSHFARGGNGARGKAANNCLNIGIPILSGIGLGGSGKASGATCNASTNGTGGSASN